MGAFCVLVQHVYLGVMIENVFSQSDLKIIQVQVCLWQSCLLRLPSKVYYKIHHDDININNYLFQPLCVAVSWL